MQWLIETRLLSQGTFLKAIGRSRTPKAGTGGLVTVDALPFFLQADQLKPFISNELAKSTAPVLFRLKSGQRTVGYDARLLPMVCEVYLKFRDGCLKKTGKVPSQYEHIIRACDTLMRGLALDMLADNRLVFPDDTMPSFLSHGKGTAAHAKGFNGNIPHNVANHSHAERLRGILGG